MNALRDEPVVKVPRLSRSSASFLKRLCRFQALSLDRWLLAGPIVWHPPDMLLIAVALVSMCGPREEVLLFASGAADVVDDNGVLDWVVADIAHDDSPVCIDGATDGVGADADNFNLGEQRAAAVADLLVGRGVARARLLLTSHGEEGAPQEEAQHYRRVVVRFTPRGREAADVLDLPLPPAPEQPAGAAVSTSRPTHKHGAVAKPHPVHAWVVDLDPQWRRSAGAAVVAVGAACGSSAGLGLCCVAPFTAPLGVSVAAGALDEVPEPDALSGAGIGAMVGGAVALVVAGAISTQIDNPVQAALLVTAVPATTGLGAAVGAVAGWWNSPSGRALGSVSPEWPQAPAGPVSPAP